MSDQEDGRTLDLRRKADVERTIAANTRTIVVGPYRTRRRRMAAEGATSDLSSSRSNEARLDEAVGLAGAIDLDIRRSMIVPTDTPRPATLMGKGKVEELAALAKAEEIGLFVVDAALSPVQQRNLKRRSTPR